MPEFIEQVLESDENKTKKLPKIKTTSLWTDQVLELVQQVLEGDEGTLRLHVRVRCEVAPRARLLGAVALLDAEHVAHAVGNSANMLTHFYPPLRFHN